MLRGARVSGGYDVTVQVQNPSIAGGSRETRQMPAGGSKPRRSVVRVIALALVLAGLAAPVVAAAPAGKVYRIGLLVVSSASEYRLNVDAFRERLRELGYVEGHNAVLEYKWVEGRYDRLSDLAVELVRSKVDVIVTHGTPGTRAA